MNPILQAVILASTCASNLVLAQTAPRPQTPFTVEKICPFEYGCAFDSVFVLKPIPAYSRENDTTSISGSLKPGLRLRFNFANMHISELGLAIIRKSDDCQGFQTGDSIYVITYVGEGTYQVWHKGLLEDLECFWCSFSDMCITGDLVKPPVATWWLNVASDSNHTFWLRLINKSPDKGVDFGRIVDFNWRE